MQLAAALAVVMALSVTGVRASPILTETWDQVGNVNGWNDPVPGDVTLGNSANYLSISFAAETVPLPGQDIIRTGPGSASGLTGDYVAAGIQSISFRFFAQDYVPDGLALYFYSPTTVWSLALNPAAVSVGNWTTYSVSLDYAAGWMGGPGTDASTFASDLASVDWIGVGINRSYGGCAAPPAQTYGLDDFSAATPTPEPETYVLLLAALVPLLIVFRSKLRQRWGRAV